MSVQVLIQSPLAERAARASRHRLRLRAAITAACALILALAIYGHDYYALSAADRPFSPKHELLKPSGQIGVKLGMLGVLMFLLIFLYALRKRVPWLARCGSSKHWMDFHVVLGLSAPAVIAFHASFKFRGIAGMAFWIMAAVALSGVVGRYLYAQIPRSLNAAELSLKELQQMEARFTSELAQQNVFPVSELDRVLRTPSPEEVAHMPAYRALLLMMLLDVARPIHIARLRMRTLGWGETVRSLCGLLSTSNAELESVVRTARRKSSLAKRIGFLERTQRVFHLWHVVHRPFSYSFAVLAIIHIVIVMGLGFV